MLGAFAVWALFGFQFPGTPVPIALNAVAKLLAFAAALTLFPPRPARSGPDLSPDTADLTSVEVRTSRSDE
jgi:hypothetical protein